MVLGEIGAGTILSTAPDCRAKRDQLDRPLHTSSDVSRLP
jgi:hypothetical protein